MEMLTEQYISKFFNLNLSTRDNDNNFKLLDGDYLSSLNLLTINKIVSQLSPELYKKFAETIKIGVIVTAYSNGAYFDFVNKIIKLHPYIELKLAKTGVKYLNEAAIFFEIYIELVSIFHVIICICVNFCQ